MTGSDKCAGGALGRGVQVLSSPEEEAGINNGGIMRYSSAVNTIDLWTIIIGNYGFRQTRHKVGRTGS